MKPQIAFDLTAIAFLRVRSELDDAAGDDELIEDFHSGLKMGLRIPAANASRHKPRRPIKLILETRRFGLLLSAPKADLSHAGMR